MLETISASDFVTVGTCAVSAFGTVIWALFRNVCKQVDRLTNKIEDNSKKLSQWQLDEEKRMHEMELRIINRIDQMDMAHDKLVRDIGELYSRVSTLETKVEMLHREDQ